MCQSMVDIQSVTAEIRRGKKTKEEERKKPLGKNIMACPIPQGGHNDDCMLSKSKIQVSQYVQQHVQYQSPTVQSINSGNVGRK